MLKKLYQWAINNRLISLISLIIAFGSLSIGFLNRYFPIFQVHKPNIKPYFTLIDPPTLQLIPFDVESKAPLRRKQESSVVFLPMVIDSTNAILIDFHDNIKRSIINTPIEDRYVLPEVNLMFKIKNTGGSSGKLVLLALGSGLTPDHQLRKECYYNKLNPVDINVFDNFEIRTILIGAVDSIYYRAFPLLLQEDSMNHQAILHVLLVYEEDGFFFDTYNWIKFQMNNNPIDIHTELVEEQVREHMFKVYFVRRYSKYPEISDYISYLDRTSDPVYTLTEEEQNNVKSIIKKKP